MRLNWNLCLLFCLGLTVANTSCKPNEPESDPQGTVYYEGTDENFPNPERGFYSQTYYKSDDLSAHASAATLLNVRNMVDKMTIFIHEYYLTDYMESDIPEAFLQRLDSNMSALRYGGAKAIIRFAYKDNYNNNDKPWDASPEWINKHIDQVAPYLVKNADVIMCLQAGFIGSWGEWYYTSGYKFNPSADADFVPRWVMLDHLLSVTPKDRQIALRTPGYKMRYLRMHDMDVTPLSPQEAFQPTPKARLAGHDDAFVSSDNDQGTFFNSDEREFWAADSKYFFMGGESCANCYFSSGENAIAQLTRYHWTYLNRYYKSSVLNRWITEKKMDEIRLRLGYRLVLDKAYWSQQPKAGAQFTAKIFLHNEGFASLINQRDVELVISNGAETYVFPQSVDPRFWEPGENSTATLSCTLPTQASGTYTVYLNLPDHYASLHNNPLYSVRLANKDVWEEKTGYNKLGQITIQ